MATVLETNAELDAANSGRLARVVRETNLTNSGSTVLTKGYYVLGGVSGRGRARWVTVTVADAASVQATAVLAGLA